MAATLNRAETERVSLTGPEDQRTHWRWGIVAACAMTLLSLYPQLRLWSSRGEDWQGAVAYNQGLGDEVAYAAYINALIDGRPRRNDPYTGRDDRPGASQPESLFSIQFLPAYAIALASRLLGISATTAFMVLTPLAAFASSLAVFWLLILVTGNERLAACGVIVVLCLGALAAAEGTVAYWTHSNTHFDYFPFLRRYQPAASFALFPLFCALSCQVLTEKSRRALRAILAGLVFCLLVFSYFYLWTGAAAWVAALSFLWFVARPNDRYAVMVLLVVIGTAAIVALVPYWVLISHRAATAESVQALAVSRKLDLFSPAELIGGLILLVLMAGSVRRSIDWRDRHVLFAASFALLPFIVLNQQIISGRVMQPIHYKGFVTNYSVLIAVVISLGLEWHKASGENWKLSKRALLWLVLAALDWGFVETYQTARRNGEANDRAAQELPVYLRLKEYSRATDADENSRVVLFSDLRMADGAPAVARFPVLWAPHSLVYSGTSAAESKERLYRHLYYTGVGVKELDEYFHGRNLYYGCAVGLFGFDRFIDGLNPNAKPISKKELQDELWSYNEYASSFNGERAANPRLSYVVVPIDDDPDLSNLDRWYERDAGERVGQFKLYRVALRNEVRAEVVRPR